MHTGILLFSNMYRNIKKPLFFFDSIPYFVWPKPIYGKTVFCCQYVVVGYVKEFCVFHITTQLLIRRLQQLSLITS